MTFFTKDYSHVIRGPVEMGFILKYVVIYLSNHTQINVGYIDRCGQFIFNLSILGGSKIFRNIFKTNPK